jgi:hypothetical protein
MKSNIVSRVSLLALLVIFGIAILMGCTNKSPSDESGNDKTGGNTDIVTSPSQAPDEASFKEAISKDGYYIIITSGDLNFSEDLFVEGTFTKKDSEGKDAVSRSLALAQYGKDNEIIRHTLTAPKLVINSENTLLEYGIVKGDVYVQAPGFITKDATIEGNLYFENQDLMDEFSLDDETTITKEIAVKKYE